MIKYWLRSALFSVFVAAGCAASGVTPDSTNDDDDGASSAGGMGGTENAGGAGASGGMGGEGGTGGMAPMFPCGIDCSTIETDDCHQAVCNLDTKQCAVEPLEDGTECDDGKFCTTEDRCDAGECTGGPQNDCGLSAPACNIVVCEELTQSCSVGIAVDGAPCQAANLCLTQTSCKSGLCIGQPKDCFFAPVPNECHIAECNPQNGLCEPVPGNDGQSCNDLNDLCVDGKTCSQGACVGGSVKNCSQLTQGCVTGSCNPQNGQCQAVPVPDGGVCDDLNPCTEGETCQMGNCASGVPVTMCNDGDSCCPMGCDQNNDQDCAITDLDVGPYNTTYSSSSGTRGYWFTAPTNFVIKEVRVPTDVGTEPQNIQIVRFNNGPPPTYSQSTTNYTTLAYHKAVAGPNYIVVNIPVMQGDVIGILGARGTSTMKNSYGSGNPYATTLFNFPIQLKRLIYQSNLHNSQAGPLSTENGGSYSRIEMRYGP